MRFKCVSKAWETLIRHPNFAKLHNTRSQSRPSATHLLFDLKRRTFQLQSQLEGISLQLAPHHYYSDSRSKITTCSNHCNGLVCVYSYQTTQVYLYNVTTGEIKQFSLSQESHMQYPGIPVLFLGFDPVTENYKVLHVIFPYEKRQTIKILTLGTNK